MKLFYKILKPVAFVISGVAVVMLIAALSVQNKVADIVLRSLSNNISTKFEIGSLRLSFIKRFPKATLDLKNVLVHSSPGFDTKCFGKNDTDTLLAARSVIMEFRIKDIINGYYNIEGIGIRNGFLRILTDTSGRVNYEIRSVNGSGTENDLVINLEDINLTNVKAIYDNRATKLVVGGVMDNGRLKSKISQDNIDFTARGDLEIDSFRLYNFYITNSIRTKVNVRLNSKEDGVLFDKSTLTFDNNRFGIEGFISSNNLLDLSLSGENIDIADLKHYLPEDYVHKTADYDPGGLLDIEAEITGTASRKSGPGIKITFALQNGYVTNKSAGNSIRNLFINGSFTNGPGMIPRTSSLKIENFRGTLGSSAYTGSLMLSDFSSLNGELVFKATLIPSDLKEFFNLKSIYAPAGSVETDLRVNGKVPPEFKFRISDLSALKSNGRFSFHSFGAGFKKNIRIDNASGLITLSDKISARDLSFTYNGQKISLNGTFSNLPGWLSGDAVTLRASASVVADRITVETFLPGQKSEKTDNGRKNLYSLPANMILDLNFDIGNLRYKNFDARNITGTLNYKPQMFDFKTLKLNSLDGSVSGNGFFMQNVSKSFVFKGNFNFEDINVKNAFTVFNNFGQDFIKDKNLEGLLSGSLTILMPMDHMLHPLVKSVTVEGSYLLEKGALVNFEPVKELSEFIDISELGNIRFEELSNDFFIRNNALYIPQMDVRSSAANLAINGRHGFDNDYEYHVKILLSEILSKRIPKAKPNTTEFGAVRDDGLGRTSLLLKIEDRGNEVKVSYDVKAAGSRVKDEMQKEKQSLRTILNEEYGWFKNDSSVTDGNTEKSRPRFKVKWEEGDTIETNTEESTDVKKEKPLRNLFKKR